MYLRTRALANNNDDDDDDNINSNNNNTNTTNNNNNNNNNNNKTVMSITDLEDDRLLRLFGSRTVIYFVTLHLNGISEIVCLQMLVIYEVIQRSVCLFASV